MAILIALCFRSDFGIGLIVSGMADPSRVTDTGSGGGLGSVAADCDGSFPRAEFAEHPHPLRGG